MKKQSSQIITFVIDKDLDIKNHFIALNAYKRNKERGFPQNKEESSEDLLNLSSDEEIQAQIEKSIESYYTQSEKLDSLAEDINKEWIKIESDFIKRLEVIHKFPFPYTSVKGVLSSANRFGYEASNGWFATNMRQNKYICMDVATHELMHFMFHKYYDQVCKERGLSQNQMWDVKESFTVLLNIEFTNFRFQSDNGRPPHLKLREIIKKSWLINHDFDKALNDVIEYVKTDTVSV